MRCGQMREDSWDSGHLSLSYSFVPLVSVSSSTTELPSTPPLFFFIYHNPRPSPPCPHFHSPTQNLPAILLAIILIYIMNFLRTSSPSKALEGVHGIHVMPHAPFAVEEISQKGDMAQSSCESSDNRVNQLLLMQRVWQQRPGCLRPIHGCINGDQHLAETVANVLTSLPFVALGIQAPRKNLSMKLYANSLIGVGVASSLYHCSRGKIRKYLRWLDYTMIATATVCLSRALRNENHKLLMAASGVLLPIQPLMVSAVHAGMMEVAFAKRALKDPDLRMAHNMHKISSLLGGVLFVADDLFPTTPFLHAGWHLAAAVGVGTCNKLLE